MGCTLTPGGYFGKITPPPKQVLYFANHSEPRSLDPHKSAGTSEGNITKELFEGLTIYHPKTLDPVSAGAVSWESEDAGRIWTFHLRKECRWSDGHPVTAHDYVYAWRRVVDPETASPYVALMFYVKNGEAISNSKASLDTLGVQAIDDYTLRVEMEHPTAFFLKMTPHFIFAPLPKWSVEKFGPKWVEPENIVTNGPFRLVAHRANDEVTLQRDPNYWDVANVKLEEAHFLPVMDAMALNLYKAGELDTMMSGVIPLPFTKVVKTKEDYCSGSYFSTYYYSVNVTRPPFDNPVVRQALNLALNKAEIAEKLLGRGEKPATLLVPPGITGYEPGLGPQFNPEEARKLLAQAGYPDGQGFPKFTIYYNTQDSHRQIAETVQRMWKDNLHLTVELQNEEWNTFQARWERRDFDVCRDVWQGDYLDPTTYLDLYATDNLNNHSGWLDAKYSQMLKDASIEVDPAKRFRLLAEAEHYLIDKAPIIPIYFYANSYLKKPYVDGYYVNLLDVHQFKYVSIVTK